MPLNRRQFVNLATGSVATCLLSEIASAANNAGPAIKAIAFDGFTTFDPRSVSALAEQLFAGRGPKFSNLWRTRQFEYTG
jgi:2-haloacid dehalogenase